VRKIEAAEVKDILEYERLREAAKARHLELTRHRRVPVGDRVTFLFENRDTVWFQVQEMIRIERIVDARKVQDEIDTYNGLIPAAGELSATLFIEIPEIARLPPQEVRRQVDRFLGLERDSVYLELGRQRLAARFEGGGSREERMSAVHFLRFTLPAAARLALADAKARARLVVEHPSYQAQSELPGETRAALLADLESS
jgi:hypothetical protein